MDTIRNSVRTSMHMVWNEQQLMQKWNNQLSVNKELKTGELNNFVVLMTEEIKRNERLLDLDMLEITSDEKFRDCADPEMDAQCTCCKSPLSCKYKQIPDESRCICKEICFCYETPIQPSTGLNHLFKYSHETSNKEKNKLSTLGWFSALVSTAVTLILVWGNKDLNSQDTPHCLTELLPSHQIKIGVWLCLETIFHMIVTHLNFFSFTKIYYRNNQKFTHENCCYFAGHALLLVFVIGVFYFASIYTQMIFLTLRSEDVAVYASAFGGLGIICILLFLFCSGSSILATTCGVREISKSLKSKISLLVILTALTNNNVYCETLDQELENTNFNFKPIYSNFPLSKQNDAKVDVTLPPSIYLSNCQISLIIDVKPQFRDAETSSVRRTGEIRFTVEHTSFENNHKTFMVKVVDEKFGQKKILQKLSFANCKMLSPKVLFFKLNATTDIEEKKSISIEYIEGNDLCVGSRCKNGDSWETLIILSSIISFLFIILSVAILVRVGWKLKKEFKREFDKVGTNEENQQMTKVQLL